MPYIGYEPAKKPLTSADITDGVITSASIADGTIVNADINASAGLALSKLSTTGTASSSNYLRGDGAWTAVSSDYVLLASTDASSSASISFDGYFSSTYKNYKVIVSSAINATNQQDWKMRFRRSNADVTASNYSYSGTGWYTGSDTTNGATSLGVYNQTSFIIAATQSNNSGYTICNDITIFDPLGTNNYKQYAATSFAIYNNGTIYYYSICNAGALTNALTAISGVTFFFSSGNITSGNFKLYGIK